jgi:AraC-like DNA-binding protein
MKNEEFATATDGNAPSTAVANSKLYTLNSTLQKAKEYLALFDNSGYGKTFAARRMIAPAQMALGMYNEALATYDEIERRMAGDTLNEDYAVIRRSRAIAAREKKHFSEAYYYQTRNADLSKILSDSLMKGKANEYAARYHAQEQQLQIREKEAEADQFRIVSLAVAALALLAVAFAVYFFYQKRIVNEKNHGLVRLIDETIAYKERFVQLQNAIRRPSPEKSAAAPAELKTLSDGELFQHLCDDIRENKLYLDPMFDRQAVCDRYNLSIAQVGSAFAQGSDYSSVADFIRDCRLEHACVLLKTTDMKVTDVAAASGFSRPTTFNHDFKARFNLSPTEYRRQ